MRVLGISGSLRAESYNTQLLRAAAEVLPEGVELELYDGLRELPHYDQDVEDEGAPAPVQDLRALTRTRKQLVRERASHGQRDTSYTFDRLPDRQIHEALGLVARRVVL